MESVVHLTWQKFRRLRDDRRDEDGQRQPILMDGFLWPIGREDGLDTFLLAPEPPGCCPMPEALLAECLLVHFDAPIPYTADPVCVRGHLKAEGNAKGVAPRFRLAEAALQPNLAGDPAILAAATGAGGGLTALGLALPGRRDLIRNGAAFAAGALVLLGSKPLRAQAAGGDAAALLAGAYSYDTHSHSGGWIRGRPYADEWALGRQMRLGNQSAASMAVVADWPLLGRRDGKIYATRKPGAGELYQVCHRQIESLLAAAKAQDLAIALNPADLESAKAAGRPALVLSFEGADGLEGRIERLEEFHALGVRNIQLVHYRVNELGDIQTETPVHNGLTDFGVEVIKKMNELKIIVDVAHAPISAVRKAAEVSSKPLLLSHTSVHGQISPLGRTINAEHARVIAQTGGVIGIWPPKFVFRDIDGWVDGIARAVDAAGIDHVGIGSDMDGLGPTGSSVFESYGQLPAVAAALLRRFKPPEAAKILGENMMRLHRATAA